MHYPQSSFFLVVWVNPNVGRYKLEQGLKYIIIEKIWTCIPREIEMINISCFSQTAGKAKQSICVCVCDTLRIDGCGEPLFPHCLFAKDYLSHLPPEFLCSLMICWYLLFSYILKGKESTVAKEKDFGFQSWVQLKNTNADILEGMLCEPKYLDLQNEENDNVTCTLSRSKPQSCHIDFPVCHHLEGKSLSIFISTCPWDI